MTIIVDGHVESLSTTTADGIMVTVKLESERGNGQLIEIRMIRAEATNFLPGTGIKIRMDPVP